MECLDLAPPVEAEKPKNILQSLQQQHLKAQKTDCKLHYRLLLFFIIQLVGAAGSTCAVTSTCLKVVPERLCRIQIRGMERTSGNIKNSTLLLSVVF